MFKSKKKAMAMVAKEGVHKLDGDNKLEHFTPMKVLGTGSFGVVKLVKHEPTGLFYALKIVNKYETIKHKQVEHMLAEKAVLMVCNHPNLVNFAGSFQDSKHLYIIMEFVNGGEMFTHLRDAGRFEVQQSRMFAADIINGLSYLHNLQIAYRDLKPENILLDSNGHAKITDFGFAKKIEYKTWTLCGTPEYLAPEVILSQGHNKGVDWWCVGILIYEMMSGNPPWVADDPLEIYQKILGGKLKFPWGFDKTCKDLVKRLLDPDTTRRLGCMKNGVRDIQTHKFFKEVDWAELTLQQGTYSTGPMALNVKGPSDTRYFDNFPDMPDRARDIRPEDQSLFDGF